MEKALAQSPGEKYQSQDVFINQEGQAEVLELRPYDKSSFALRTLACLIDQAIIIIPSFIFAGCMCVFSFFALSFSNLHDDFIAAVMVATGVSSFFALHWLYFSLSESSEQMGTFGMSILGIKVLKRGKKLNFFEANNRYWYWVFTTLFFGINTLGLLGHTKELFHDQLSDTQVVVES
ncbi:MAG: hypothetical protein CME70_02290 [Halobacteriovorax sp.]|nr:hypothetical protein [Halobacteriovorax sp.]|tara:strand:- start:62994 stop:63527 length:534 start_codon:yes stop_codon:yes gene_type:complete